MPKKKPTKQRARKGVTSAAKKALEENTLKLGTSSANGHSTVFRERGKTIDLFCEVEPPVPMQQPLLSVEQELGMDLDIKQELLDTMNSNKEEQLLDSINLPESDAVSTLVNHAPSIEIKTEKDVDAKANSIHTAAIESDQKLNNDFSLGKLAKPKEAQNSTEQQNLVLPSEPTANDSTKLDSQRHIEIKQELLISERNSSPAIARLNSTVKVDSKFDKIEHPSISDDFISDGMKKSNGSSEQRNSILRQFSFSSDSSIIDIENMQMQCDRVSSDLQKVKLLHEKSNQLPLTDIVQTHKTVLQTNQKSNGTLSPAVSSSNEQFRVFDTEYSKTSITAPLENIQTAVCQDAGTISGEIMSDNSNASTIIVSPENSPSHLLNSNNLLDDNSNTYYKTLRKIKEETIDAEIDSSMADDILFDNSVLSSERGRENSEPGENQTPPYSDRFLHSWGLTNLLDSEEVLADESVFSELGTHFRLLGYQQEKTGAITTFGKKTLKEHGYNKKLAIDHLLLEKLFPSAIPQTSEENKLDEKLAKLCLLTSVPPTIAKVEYKTRNLEDRDATSEIAQTGVQNANSSFEPEVEKIIQMDIQDADRCFESKVEKISQMDSQDAGSSFELKVEKIAPINSQGIGSCFEPEVEKIVQMDSQDASSCMEYKTEKTDVSSEGTFKLDVQMLKDILKKCSNNLNENVKDSTCNTESCSASNLSLIENNPSSTQLVSSSVFDDNEANKHSPSNTNQLHNTRQSLQEDSDDSCIDNSRAEDSDDSDATVKNLSFEEQLNPELPLKKTQKKKSDSQDTEFVPRKKSRYEIIMERKEQEKLLKVTNYGVKEKSMSLHNKSSQLSTNSQLHKDLEIFHPTPAKLPSLQKKKTPESKKDDTKGKAKPLTEKSKMDTHDKKKKDEKSNHSSFSDMDAGMRFTNRNSSLFEDITKVAQQPVPCRPRPVPQKNAKSNTNHLTMEEVHAQIDTNLISLPEPQKKKLSVKDYLSRNKTLPSLPMSRDMLHTESRLLPPSTQPFPASHLIQDPRLTRRQSGDSSPNLKYIRSYQPNVMSQPENVLQLNNSMQTSTPCNPPNSDHNIWNNSLSQENHVLPTMGPVSAPMTAYLLHSNISSTPPISSFLSSLQTAASDDMNLHDSEPPVPPQTISPVQFHSSHRTQNFDSIRSSASSSYLRDPRRLPTTSHYSGPPLASAITSSSNVNFPGPRSEDDPYEVNLLPLRLSQSVGQTVMSVPEALMIILSWVPAWFKEVDRPDQREPPPLWRNAMALKETRPCYDDMTDHFTTVFPLMLFDLFFRMHDMHKSVKDKNAKTHVLDFIKPEIVGDMMEIEAKVVLPAGKPHFTIEGQLAVLTYALKSGKKRDVFGFISNQSIYPNHIGEEVLHVCIKIIHGVQNLNREEKISVFPFYPLSKVICQIDALGYIDISPLRNILLKPSAPACTRIVLERFGSLAENVHIVNRAIEKIKDGISLNEPEEPRILIIDSPLGTDLASTLIGVIEDVKKSETPSEKQPILICTRSIKQLVNIGLRLLPTGGKESECSVINTTILVKAKGISDSDLKKLTLEHKIIQSMKSVKRKEQQPEDVVHKEVKKGILKNSDVVLSHIPQSYDSSVQAFFGIGKELQFSFCIIDEAYTFTEPEVSLPLLYGIKKLILAGDPKEKPRVVSKISDRYKFYQALPSRLSVSMTS